MTAKQAIKARCRDCPAGSRGYEDFLGRPLPGTLRIASRTSGAYIASRVMGLNPARCMRLSTVFGSSPNILDISDKVNPVIPLIIGLYNKYIIKMFEKNDNIY
jgi:hypothetical protein